MEVDAGQGRTGGSNVVTQTLVVGLSLAGVACAITLVYLSMRAVLDVGGFCAEGGPYDIRVHCPQGTPGIMMGSIWGGLILAGVYAYCAARWGITSFVSLLWSALFLPLGANFLEYAFYPPGPGGGVVWGWLICGVLFVAMGGLPLLVVLPYLYREFVRGETQQHGFPGGVPVVHVRRAARGIGFQPSGSHLATDLEKLDSLHRSGALSDDEYEAAKRRIVGNW